MSVEKACGFAERWFCSSLVSMLTKNLAASNSSMERHFDHLGRCGRITSTEVKLVATALCTAVLFDQMKRLRSSCGSWRLDAGRTRLIIAAVCEPMPGGLPPEALNIQGNAVDADD